MFHKPKIEGAGEELIPFLDGLIESGGIAANDIDVSTGALATVPIVPKVGRIAPRLQPRSIIAPQNIPSAMAKGLGWGFAITLVGPWLDEQVRRLTRPEFEFGRPETMTETHHELLEIVGRVTKVCAAEGRNVMPQIQEQAIMTRQRVMIAVEGNAEQEPVKRYRILAKSKSKGIAKLNQ